jgi:2-iminoacetate synthase
MIKMALREIQTSPRSIHGNQDFAELMGNYPWEEVVARIQDCRAADVEEALHEVHSARVLRAEQFVPLISPAAAAYIEPMAQLSRKLTLKRFGKTMQLFAPLYLSNECQNICTYCGFSLDNKIPRKTLSGSEIFSEAQALKNLGFDHVLVVTGEANQIVGLDYFQKAFEVLLPLFSQISLEVQPMDQADYEALIPMGLNNVLVYQETYRRETYKTHHPKGRKSNFDYRLDTPDRLGKAGVHKIGLGVLIGLEDWRADSWFTALHLRYLQKRYWKTRYSISFPRLRPHAGGIPVVEMNETELVQLITAWRLFDENLDLSLSTRESVYFRNHAFKLGISSMSAGSKTNPGGYELEEESLEQFSISDERSPAQVASMLQKSGYEVVWKDWEQVYNS